MRRKFVGVRRDTQICMQRAYGELGQLCMQRHCRQEDHEVPAKATGEISSSSYLAISGIAGGGERGCSSRTGFWRRSSAIIKISMPTWKFKSIKYNFCAVLN